jgi:putative Holliday junction resolvase
MKILAVDPGLKRIGLAVSDPTGTVARALAIFEHGSLQQDCVRILEVAHCEKAERIFVGNSHEPGTKMNELARFAHKLLASLRAATPLPVTLYDESFSTQRARDVLVARGKPRKTHRRMSDDALAAAAFLQEYLDVQADNPEKTE